MDFLKIRKKAKERAQARAAEEPAKAPAAAPSPGAPAPAAAAAGDEAAPAEALPAAEPVLTQADVTAGELAARLQGLSAPPDPALAAFPDAGAEADAAGFTTWRPGSGAPPFAPVPEGAPVEPDHSADYRVVIGAAPGAALPAAPARPPPPPRRPTEPLESFFYRPDEEAPQLPAFGPGAAEAAEAEAVELQEYLTFSLGPEEYAVAIERVREVIRSPPITEVPRAPADVLGVVTVRGEVVAVVDPRRRLGLTTPPPGEGAGKVVIVDAGDGPCGLLVDRVMNVVRLRPGSIEPCPQGIAGPCGECLAGIGRDGERLFTVLELAAVLRRALVAGAERRADATA